ncbi:MAG: hypothetical protein GY867_03605 [bacterium]|nr:hypothetical protein [bacterium]
MKKFLLGIVLIAALVGVVYLKSERADQFRSRLTEEGFLAGLAEGEDLRSQVDSLAGLVVRKDSALAESVAVHDGLYAGEIDSLTEKIQSQEVQISDLNGQLAKNKKATQVAVKKKSQKPDKKHLEILSYYKKAVTDLPGDLSAYERRIALSEIRNETAQKFAITVSRLNSIRKDNNLEY